MSTLTIESLHRVVEELRPVIEQHREDGERDRQLSREVVSAMKEAGLFKLWMPREFGGEELDLPSFLSVIEQVSTADAAAGWVLANMAGNNMQSAFMPREGANDIYSSDPSAPTGGAFAPRGRAIPVEGGYRITGRWPLVSGCQYAGWLSMGALIFDGDAPRMGPHGVPDLKMFAVPISECQILDTWYATGMRGTGSTDVSVNDAFVPESRTFSTLTEPPKYPAPVYRLGLLALFSCALTSVGLGIARSAIDSFVELAKGKTPTLSQSTLGGRPVVHAEVARAEAKLQSARAFLFEVANEMMAVAEAGGQVSDDLEARRRLACVNSAASCEEAVDAMFRLGGSTSIYSGHRLEQCLRDIHVMNQHLVVSPVWWEKTGQYYFGLGLGMP